MYCSCEQLAIYTTNAIFTLWQSTHSLAISCPQMLCLSKVAVRLRQLSLIAIFNFEIAISLLYVCLLKSQMCSTQLQTAVRDCNQLSAEGIKSLRLHPAFQSCNWLSDVRNPVMQNSALCSSLELLTVLYYEEIGKTYVYI